MAARITWTLSGYSHIMRKDYSFETPRCIRVTELRVTRHPIVATIIFSSDGIVYEFRCFNPKGVGKFAEGLQLCDQIRVVDLNDQNAALEFGRYVIEIWDEDDPLVDFSVDRYEQIAVDTLS